MDKNIFDKLEKHGIDIDSAEQLVRIFDVFANAEPEKQSMIYAFTLGVGASSGISAAANLRA